MKQWLFYSFRPTEKNKPKPKKTLKKRGEVLNEHVKVGAVPMVFWWRRVRVWVFVLLRKVSVSCGGRTLLKADMWFIGWVGGGTWLLYLFYGKKLWVCHRGGSDFHPSARPAVVLSPNRNTHASQRSGWSSYKDHRGPPGSEYPVVKFQFFVLTASSSIWCFFFTGLRVTELY